MHPTLLSLFIETYRKASGTSGIVDGLCTRLDSRGAKDSAEGQLKALDDCNCQIHRNGSHGYFWNCEPDEWARAAKALELIKDDVGFKLLKQAMGVFTPTGPKSDPLAKRHQVDRLGDRQRSVLGQVDSSWFKHRPKQERLIIDFCTRNAQSLTVIEKAPSATRASLTWISESSTDYQLYERFSASYGSGPFASFGFEGELLFSSAREFLCTSIHDMKLILVVPFHGKVAKELLPVMEEMQRYLHLHLVAFGGRQEVRGDAVRILTSSDVSAITSAVRAVIQPAE